MKEPTSAALHAPDEGFLGVNIPVFTERHLHLKCWMLSGSLGCRAASKCSVVALLLLVTQLSGLTRGCVHAAVEVLVLEMFEYKLWEMYPRGYDLLFLWG